MPAYAGMSGYWGALSLAAELIELLLHIVELLLELVHLAAGRALRLVFRWLALAARERRGEHGECLFEHFHVAPHLILERAEAADAEGLRDLLAEFALLAGERLHGLFEEARHHHLHAVAVEADQLPQEGDRQQALPFLVLLLGNDLRQHRARDVLAGLGVKDDEILAFLHHGGEVLECDVCAGPGIVEPPVGVFLDCDRLFFVSHGDDIAPAPSLSITGFGLRRPPFCGGAAGPVGSAAIFDEGQERADSRGVSSGYPLLTGLSGLPRMRQRQMASYAAQTLAKRSFG